MSLPKKMTYDQLIANGFSINPSDRRTARHNRYNSVRYLCVDCEQWVNKAIGHEDVSVCQKCDIKRMKAGR